MWPIRDRIDMHIGMEEVTYGELTGERTGETSKDIRARVNAARRIQQRRYAGEGIFSNAELTNETTDRYCPLSKDCKDLMEAAYNRFALSARAVSRVLKVSRTIADLADAEDIEKAHVAEAIQYRTDAKYWG